MKYILILALTLTAIVTINGKIKIINGKDAEEGQFPHQVYIIFDVVFTGLVPKSWTCGGSIIHKRWILTAAHCFRHMYPWIDIFVYAGSVHKSKMKLFEGGSIIRHARFGGSNKSDSFAHDIGLIRLEADLIFNDRIKPIKLANNETIKYENAEAIISGFGRTRVQYYPAPNHLQYAISHIMEHEECKKIWQQYIYDSQICIDTIDNVSTSFGDSGGPLIVGNTLVGVTSFGCPRCNPRRPPVFVRVSSFYSWISEKLNLYGDKL